MRSFWADFITDDGERLTHQTHTHEQDVAENAAGESEILARVRRSVIGYGHKFDTPFGTKSMLYADYTASGRALGPVEDYVREKVCGCACMCATLTQLRADAQPLARASDAPYICGPLLPLRAKLLKHAWCSKCRRNSYAHVCT